MATFCLHLSVQTPFSNILINKSCDQFQESLRIQVLNTIIILLYHNHQKDERTNWRMDRSKKSALMKWIFRNICRLNTRECKEKKIKLSCTGRESNPGLPRGRREFYHWTTSACLEKRLHFLVLETLLKGIWH